ncbi:MAG: Glu/Leu/Phe/Val dehydrogenase [Chloroflexota bacterium]
MKLEFSTDEFGPHKVLSILEPRIGLSGFVVVDNVACGPSIGGIRMLPDVTVEEVARLARAMTWKNAAAGLPHGGGKAGIVADPAMERSQKETMIRAFGRAIRDLTDYIPGPDMGTDETCMAWLQDEIGRCIGLPRALGGIPLDTVGATGFGVAICAEVLQEITPLRLKGARVALQGFGAVGKHAARFLEERGAAIVAVADIGGGVYHPGGLPVADLLAHKYPGQSVSSFAGGTPVPGDDFVAVDCDVWIPAARPDVLTRTTVERLRAKYVIQGANIPATLEAEVWMHERNILSVPDFIANAGGVICGAVEYRGGSQTEAFAVIKERISENTRTVVQAARSAGSTPRAAGEAMAKRRVQEAESYRR